MIIIFIDTEKQYQKLMFTINTRQLYSGKEWVSPTIEKIINSFKKARFEIN